MDYMIKKIDRSDKEGLTAFSNMVNAGSFQKSFKVNPMKLVKKLGTIGGIYGLYTEDGELVGGIGMKHKQFGDVNAGEVAYLIITEEHRSMKNLILLFKRILIASKKFDMVYFMTEVRNKVLNKLMDRSPKIEYVFDGKSPVGNMKVKYWLSTINNKQYTPEDQAQILRDNLG